MEPGFRNLVLKIFEKCAGNSGCDICRVHMEEDCLFFPELYRLDDLAQQSKIPPDEQELRSLINRCTLCGICPCRDIRDILLQAKAALAKEDKLPLSGRILSDAEAIGRWGTRFSAVLNPLSRLKPVQSIAKTLLDIDPGRDLPVFPGESFFRWARKKGLTAAPPANDLKTPKAAYFAGCSAGYLFPEVGKAAVKILEKSGVSVFVPSQNCCGMPLLAEGNKKTALEKISSNLKHLWEYFQDGYDIVCSCPTCGYFFKKMLPENAYFSDAFQKRSGSGENVIKVPIRSGADTFATLPRSIYQKLLKDDGYFSSIDPLVRIDLSLNIKDLGEYLLSLQARGKLSLKPQQAKILLAYFAPCHQREQGIGQPYFEILRSFPGADIIRIGEVMDCCGMGGHLGYKAGFHAHSLTIGQPVFNRLSKEPHRTLVTDCLSCRLQFGQVLSREVFHPLELL